MKKTWLMMLCLSLAGCAGKSENAPVSLVTPQQTAPVKAEPRAETSLTANETCVKELAALRIYNRKAWNRNSDEMKTLTGQTSLFISVKEGVDPGISNIVANTYSSRMQTLCYRIQSTLGQAMVSQSERL